MTDTITQDELRAERARERKARRGLARMGQRLNKSRIHPENQNGNNWGGYRIIDDANVVVGGHYFNMTLEDVEAWVAE